MKCYWHLVVGNGNIDDNRWLFNADVDVFYFIILLSINYITLSNKKNNYDKITYYIKIKIQ
jgi:hypothetical protein